MEGFLAPSMTEIVTYCSSSYRYTKEKPGHCYLKFHGLEIFSMNRNIEGIQWFQSEAELKKGQQITCQVTEVEVERLHEAKPMIPEQRLRIILLDQKVNECAKSIIEAQNQLIKTDFTVKAMEYLASSIDKSIECDDILLNVFALIDRRMGKSRLRKLKDTMAQKHSIVHYVYQQRCNAEKL